ncbi:MAG: hypothetical protein D6712_16795 [Chloroflexi bacterium]|nr:MAG: hypothetical protein D6712_16795 [Chloroflexota bacterium]
MATIKTFLSNFSEHLIDKAYDFVGHVVNSFVAITLLMRIIGEKIYNIWRAIPLKPIQWILLVYCIASGLYIITTPALHLGYELPFYQTTTALSPLDSITSLHQNTIAQDTPLYYILATTITRLSDNVIVRLFLLRTFSAVLGTISLYIFYRATRLLSLEPELAPITITAAAFLLPDFLYRAISATPTAFIVLACSLLLYSGLLIYIKGLNGRRAAGAILALTLVQLNSDIGLLLLPMSAWFILRAKTENRAFKGLLLAGMIATSLTTFLWHIPIITEIASKPILEVWTIAPLTFVKGAEVFSQSGQGITLLFILVYSVSTLGALLTYIPIQQERVQKIFWSVGIVALTSIAGLIWLMIINRIGGSIDTYLALLHPLLSLTMMFVIIEFWWWVNLILKHGITAMSTVADKALLAKSVNQDLPFAILLFIALSLSAPISYVL